MNIYGYAINNPVLLRDPSGLDALTFGACDWCTITWGRDKMYPAQIAAEDAHEAQHRLDWDSVVLPMWLKEQRGFAAELDILVDRIRQVEQLIPASKCAGDDTLAGQYQNELNALMEQWTTSHNIAMDDYQARTYWNATHPFSQVPNPYPPAGPPFRIWP